MLRKSFVLFRGIGAQTERKLWSRGTRDWSQLVLPGSGRRARELLPQIESAEAHYGRQDAPYFYDSLPAAQRWRLLPDLQGKVAFVDVEVDGSSSYASPTVVGVCAEGGYRCLVRGMDLTANAMRDALCGAEVLVTFNGRRHDLHFMRKLLPVEWKRTRIIDLRYVALQAGFRGGLKQLERSLGIQRSRYVELAANGQAVTLWRMWRRRGTRRALELLEAYNREDTANLLPISLRLSEILEKKAETDVVR